MDIIVKNKTQVISWVVSLILLLIGLYNQAAIYFNLPHVEFGTQELTDGITLLYNVVIGLWVFWKNQNITPNAQISQQVLDGLNDGTIKAKVVER